MYVFRVEHYESSIGPYESEAIDHIRFSTENRPSIFTETGLFHNDFCKMHHYKPEETRYGFINIEQLESWFDNELKTFLGDTFIITQYLCSRSYKVVTTAQCVFNCSLAKKLRKLHLHTYEFLDFDLSEILEPDYAH